MSLPRSPEKGCGEPHLRVLLLCRHPCQRSNACCLWGNVACWRAGWSEKFICWWIATACRSGRLWLRWWADARA